MHLESQQEVNLTKQVSDCCLCGAPSKILYQDVRDMFFGVPGKWDIRTCTNPRCHLLWVDPIPAEDELWKLYQNYFTHTDKKFTLLSPVYWYRKIKKTYLLSKHGNSDSQQYFPHWMRILGKLLYLHPALKADYDGSVNYLQGKPHGKLLEVGCGNGSTLSLLADIGWDAEGLDFDQEAVSNARSKGLEVRCGGLVSQSYEAEKFDVVVMSHVIEHIYQPIEFLVECRRILKPNGQLIILTPNACSLGHLIFSNNWRGLEPPRHLHIFNPMSLKALLMKAGFSNVMITSAARSCAWMFINSYVLRKMNINGQKKRGFLIYLWAYTMELIECIALFFNPKLGEELVAKVYKAD